MINTNSKVQKYKLCIWKVQQIKAANSRVQKYRAAYSRVQKVKPTKFKDANVQIWIP